MSLWLSERKTAGLWAGGLWKSQQGSPYAFNLDLTTFKDTVTGQSLSCNIDGTRYDEVGGVTTAFGTDTPTICDKGLRTVGTYSNLLFQSNTLNTTWLKRGTTTVESIADDWWRITGIQSSVNGDFYQSLPNVGTANIPYSWSFKIKNLVGGALNVKNPYIGTAGQWVLPLANFLSSDEKKINKYNSNVVILKSTVSTANNEAGIVFRSNVIGETISFDIKTIAISTTKYALPYIPTTTAAVSSPSEAGNSSTGTGIWIDDVASNFPLLNTALTSQGTLTFKWKTGFNDADVSGNLNILSFDGTTNSISYDADNNLIKITDGTNTASKALTVVADTEYTIQATWGLVSGSPKMQIAVDGTAGAQADFTGTFNPSDIYFGLENEELQYICKNPDGHDLTVLKVATWL